MPSTREVPRPGARAWRRGLLAWGVVVLTAAALGLLGHALFGQTSRLRANVAVTRSLVDANVRTLGQAQREILRLQLQLGRRPLDREAAELHAAFVDQRMQEISLDASAALGGRALLRRARVLAGEWSFAVRPAVTRALRSGRPPAALSATLRRLELAINDLASTAEIHRRTRAHDTYIGAERLQAGARRTMAAIGVACVLFLVLACLTLWFVRRHDRELDRYSDRLAGLDSQLRKLSLVAANTRNLVVITDADGRVEWVNEAFERTTGHPLAAIAGRRPGDVLHGPQTDPQVVATMRERLRAGQGFDVEIVNYTAAGEPYWVAIEVRPVRDAHGTIQNFLAVQTDITGRRRAERELRDAKDAAEESARVKARFLANMSHEIRTPLNAVIGLTGLLAQTELTVEQREYTQTARNSGELLLAIVNDILTFSALEDGAVELEQRPFAVAELVSGTVELLGPEARRRGLALRTTVAPEVPARVVGDPTRIRQILVNLLANGLKFTPSGEVHLAVGCVPGETGRPCRVRLTVTDTGVGIPADRLDRLFRPFSQVDASTTRRFGGTGLGLAICRHLTDLMGGEIGVRSVPDEGSSFWVELPLRAAAAAADPDADPAPERSAQATPPLDVLVVEDDLVNQMVAREVLRTLGYAAEVVANGREAVDAVRDRSFDVVFMDANMPVMDGETATRAIRAELPADRQPWIVAMTANALAQDRQRYLDAGMDAYLAKPFSADGLASELRRAADARRPTVDGDDGAARARFAARGALVRRTLGASAYVDHRARAVQLAHDLAQDATATALPELQGIAGQLGTASDTMSAHELEALVAQLDTVLSRLHAGTGDPSP